MAVSTKPEDGGGGGGVGGNAQASINSKTANIKPKFFLVFAIFPSIYERLSLPDLTIKADLVSGNRAEDVLGLNLNCAVMHLPTIT